MKNKDYWNVRRIIDRFDECWTRNVVTGCHEWTRPLTVCGYGQLRFEGRAHPAHRVAWVRAHGAIADGFQVMHRCDNRACVNLEHLELGTNDDNIRDKQSKGRAFRGSSGIVRRKSARVLMRNDFSSQYAIDESGCWLWRRSLIGGYGSLRVGGKRGKAHRFSYQLHFGSIPDGLVVRHKCDRPSCVNPLHLELGTQVDNIADAVARGRARGAVGERNHHAKLNRSQVIEIRRRSDLGESRVSLSKAFGVASTMISNIARGQSWKDVVCQ